MTRAAEPLLMVAGEASGDLHGARLLTALRQRRPQLAAFGMGREQLVHAGLEPVADGREISIVGIVEVLRIYRRAREIFDHLLAEVEARGCRAAILIDFSGFNLRLAKALKARGVTVLYYVSPQVWAWRKGRLKAIARYVDRMLVLFPFEVEFYRQHGIEVTHVGHPLVDEVPELPGAWDRLAAEQTPRVTRLALLPGSRASEIKSLLPRMLDAAGRLAAARPLSVALIRAPGLSDDLLAPLLATAPVPVEVVETDRFAAVADAHLALCASGTATLEVGLLRTPMIVMYALQATSYWIGRMLVRLPHFSMVNLVLGRGAVPEMIQRDAEGPRVAAAAAALLDDRARLDAMRHDLADIRPRLGATGASGRAADAIVPWLQPIGDPV